jgi:hypothetical protein
VTVRVGKEPNQQDFVVHEWFLISSSKFFRRALGGNWAESDTRVVNLPEDLPAIFQLYLEQVYTSNPTALHPSQDDLIKLNEKDLHMKVYDTYDNLAQLYVLSEKLQDTTVKNVLMQAFHTAMLLKDSKGSFQMPGPIPITIIYEGTMEGSLGRKFLAERHTFYLEM